MVFIKPPSGRTIKKVAKPIVIVGVVGAAALGAYLLFQQFRKKPTDLEAVLAEQEHIEAETIIAIENIEGIAADVALDEAQKISELQTAYNAQFIELEKSRIEIDSLESQLIDIQAQILTLETSEATYQTAITTANNILTGRKTMESNAYNTYLSWNNKLTAQKVAHQNLSNQVLNIEATWGWMFNPALVAQRLKLIFDMQGAETITASLEGSTANAQNSYLDAQQLRKNAENDYNNALANLNSFRETDLNPVREQEIALMNSIQMWKIAFSASETVINELKTQLALLGVSV